VVERLLEGVTPSLVMTDPPYGIAVDTSWLSALHIQRGKPPNTSDALLDNDDGSLDLTFLWAYPHWLIWGFPYILPPHATGWLVWDKWPGTDGTGLGNPVEMACTNLWSGFRLVRCMWGGYYRAAGEERHPHPTQKPVGVMQPYLALTEAQTVYDPFLGSGTTLIACENLGRICYGCELDPGYVAVTLQRYADLVGERPRLVA
jgi:DNA modification methylase